MKIEQRPLDRIKPYENNPRLNDSAVDAVAASIKQFGFRQPIVVDDDGLIVCGHTRYRAAQKLGLVKVPVHIAKDLTPEQIRAYRIADNKTAELAEWNLELLAAEIGELKNAGIDWSLLGFNVDELATLLDPGVKQGLCDADDVPAPPDEATTKPGDIWILGDHRLLCGDCTNPEHVRRVMDGQRAALFATDPPYLVDYDGTNHPHKWGEPDKNKDWSESYGATWDEAAANPELYEKFVAAAVADAILPNAAWYCWHASRRQAMLEAVWEKHGAFVHQQIIWAKDRPILTRSWYMWQHEPCFFGWVRPNKPKRFAKDHPHSVWNVPTIPPGAKTDHPTSKPVELFAIPICQHTKAGDICYEPFAGSGSQIIAAEQASRRCFAIEISPIYVHVCVERWENFTGRKAERALLPGIGNKCTTADAQCGQSMPLRLDDGPVHPKCPASSPHSLASARSRSAVAKNQTVSTKKKNRLARP
ncbi:MAG TPA: DNA modification methylase [Phycisphaerae bacterium]|nr:DNA modification methylase [Phycisphaerae bacterium]